MSQIKTFETDTASPLGYVEQINFKGRIVFKITFRIFSVNPNNFFLFI